MKKFYLAAAVFVALSLFLTNFLVYAVFTQIKKNSEEFLVLKNKAARLLKEQEQTGSLETVYRKNQAYLDVIDRALISAKVPLDLISFLEQQAFQSRLEMEISSVTQRPIKDDPWPSLTVQLSVGGSFSDILRFLDKLENSPYLIELMDLSVKKDKEGSDVVANVSIKVFAQ